MANVLVIDDDSAVCDFISEFLGQAGHAVLTASKLDCAYDRLAHSSPDLVLLDVRMPEISGLELLPRIKAFHPSASVIVITAVNDYRLEDLFFEFGADGYLLKPFRGSQLLDSIERVLTQKTA